MENFDADIAELLEVDSIKGDESLEEFEAWDSLTSLSIIAYISEHYNISCSARELVEVKTIDGLKNMIASKQGKKNL